MFPAWIYLGHMPAALLTPAGISTPEGSTDPYANPYAQSSTEIISS